MPMIHRIGLAVVLLLAPLLIMMAFCATPARANVVCAPGAAAIDFGAAVTATGSISYRCTNFGQSAERFTVCQGIGNPSFPGTAAQPKMQHQGSGATLAFNLYTDSRSTIVWTQTNPLTSTITVPPRQERSGNFTFFGRIASGQQAPTGTYAAFFFNTVLGFVQAGNPRCQANLPNFNGQDFTLTVNAGRVDNCELGVSNAVDFGAHSGLDGEIDAVGAVRLQCPIGRGWTLSFDGGRYASGADRRMRSANGDYVTYRLYRDTARMNPIAINGSIAGTGTAALQSTPIYGRASIGRGASAGDYADAVIVVLEF